MKCWTYEGFFNYLENQMNSFLSSNPGIEIVNISHSGNGANFKAIVIYKLA